MIPTVPFSAALYFWYKRSNIISVLYIEGALIGLYLVCFALTHPNWSTRVLYSNVSVLAGSCESQVFHKWDEDTAAAGDPEHPVQVGFDLTLFYLSIILKRPFWGYWFTYGHLNLTETWVSVDV